MPDSALISRCQTCSTPSPRGQAMPMPVTTTRRMFQSPPGRDRSGGLLLFDVFDSVLHRADLLGGILGNHDPERLLESHHQLDRIEAVGAKIVDERGFGRDLGFLYSEVLDHNFFHLICD